MPKGKAPMVSMAKAKESKDPQQGEALEMTEKVAQLDKPVKPRKSRKRPQTSIGMDWDDSYDPWNKTRRLLPIQHL
jgi:hypothetical protein